MHIHGLLCEFFNFSPRLNAQCDELLLRVLVAVPTSKLACGCLARQKIRQLFEHIMRFIGFETHLLKHIEMADHRRIHYYAFIVNLI